MKYLIGAVVAIVFCSSVYAMRNYPSQGAYIGLSGSLLSPDFNYSSETTIDLPTGGVNPDTERFNDNGLNTKITPSLGARLGYHYTVADKYSIGGEVFVAYNQLKGDKSETRTQTDATGTDIIINTNMTMESNGLNYGLDFKPGYFFTGSTLFYGVLGVVDSQFEVKSSVQYSRRVSADAGISSYDDNVNIMGYRLGLGVSTMLNKRVSLSAEYIYTKYPTKHIDHSGPVTGAQAGDTISNDVSFTPNNSQIILSLQYFF
jgi:opacity protein-like surface antigen